MSGHDRLRAGPRFNIKVSSYQYRKSHCGDTTVLRTSYLHNCISYIAKMSSFHWIGAQYYTKFYSRRTTDDSIDYYSQKSQMVVKCNTRYSCTHFGEAQGSITQRIDTNRNHDDVIKWKHFPRYWPFVRGIRPVTRSFDVFVDLRPNKRLSKQPWGVWFERSSCPSWRHFNDYMCQWI